MEPCSTLSAHSQMELIRFLAQYPNSFFYRMYVHRLIETLSDVLLLHSTRHNDERRGNIRVFHLEIYKSSAGADRTCLVFDRSASNHNLYSWHHCSYFSDTSRLPDTFA